MVTKASITNVDSAFIASNLKYIKITGISYPNSLIFLPVNTNTTLTLTGEGFTSNCVAYINNQAVTTTYTSSTSISIEVNYATTGTWSLHVTDSVTGISGAYMNGFSVRNVVGQISYTTAGTYSWLCPTGFDATVSVSAVCIGAGGGGSGGGGGLGWKNNIAVTPGTSYTVVVGAAGWPGTPGGDSYFINATTIKGGGGVSGPGNGATTGAGAAGGTRVGDGGGTGGSVPTKTSTTTYGGGGGAGGYSGNGGAAGYSSIGAGGTGGAGGGGGGDSGSTFSGEVLTGAGGSVGLYGEGASGAAGAQGAAGSTWAGSGGNGSVVIGGTTVAGYGGGGGVWYNDSYAGTVGGVRIVWGAGRAFPSTNVGP